MGQQSIAGSEKLAEAIRRRRQELGLTIEEAARKADVGTKTWCRYEAGGQRLILGGNSGRKVCWKSWYCI